MFAHGILPALRHHVLLALILVTFRCSASTAEPLPRTRQRAGHTTRAPAANARRHHGAAADRDGPAAPPRRRRPTRATTRPRRAQGIDLRCGPRAGGQASGPRTSGGHGRTSGDPTQPQPMSGADDNTGGANGECTGGVYCSTRDGSPSERQRPRAPRRQGPGGCVGKADNKNPPGQMPNAADDRNNGYECDTNNGIGKGKHGTAPATPRTPVRVPADRGASCSSRARTPAQTRTPRRACRSRARTPTAPRRAAPCMPTPGQDADCNPVRRRASRPAKRGNAAELTTLCGRPPRPPSCGVRADGANDYCDRGPR